MDPLPKGPLESTSPSKWEELFGKIPLLGWALAHALQDQRFHPIETDYMSLLEARDDDEAFGEWSEELRADAAKMMAILAEELGWKTPRFIPQDPCLVAFWAHEDGLDSVAATMRIEDEWGIVFSEEELAATLDFSLQDLLNLIKSKSQQVAGPDH